MNRIWSVAGKVLGSLLLISGSTVSFGILLALTVGHPPGWAIAILYPLLVFFGLVPAALGGFALYTSVQANQRAMREQFFRLLYLNRGRVSLLEFATTARLEPAIARQYLDTWARECLADFEVTENGEIYYLFPAETLQLLPERRWQMVFQEVGQAMRQAIHDRN